MGARGGAEADSLPPQTCAVLGRNLACQPQDQALPLRVVCTEGVAVAGWAGFDRIIGTDWSGAVTAHCALANLLPYGLHLSTQRSRTAST